MRRMPTLDNAAKKEEEVEEGVGGGGEEGKEEDKMKYLELKDCKGLCCLLLQLHKNTVVVWVNE